MSSILTASCHWCDSALVGGVDKNGESIFKGRGATGFTNAEEIAVNKVKVCVNVILFACALNSKHGIPAGRPLPP